MSPERAAARARLIDAKMYMRYDYAWKEAEFRRGESRLTGVACRLLYLYELWRDAMMQNADSEQTEDTHDGVPVAASTTSASRPKILIEANGYPEFRDGVAKATVLMGCELLTTDLEDPQQHAQQADFVFVYVSPHGEERVDNHYARFEAITAHHDAHQTPADKRPLFCFLLGEASFLDPQANGETERLRGLSGFAISQRLTPLLEAAAYSSVAHFAVEYTPQLEPVGDGGSDMRDLMNQFGCEDHNVMDNTEKWECYGPSTSSLVLQPEMGHADEEETRFWLELTHGKTCSHCYEWREKLSTCSRCGNAFYCSRDCQKTAWKLHKRLCGKTAEEIEAQSNA